MNNFEHIMQGGVKALMNILLTCDTFVNSCEYCAYKGTEHDVHACLNGFRAWLESEYIEPDSWDKLLEDLCKKTICDYFGHGENNPTCKECPADPAKTAEPCIQTMMFDIADRIRKLREAE